MKLTAALFLLIGSAMNASFAGATDCEEFSLWDAISDEFLTCLEKNDEIDLNALGVKPDELSVKYHPGRRAHKTKSVAFSVDGDKVQCENNEPYTIAGNSGDDFFPWEAPINVEVQIKAVNYREDDCKSRIDGHRVSVTFLYEEEISCIDYLMSLDDDELFDLGRGHIGGCQIAYFPPGAAACEWYVKGALGGGPGGRGGVPLNRDGRGTGCVKVPPSRFCYYERAEYDLEDWEREAMCGDTLEGNAAAQLRYGLRNGYCGEVECPAH